MTPIYIVYVTTGSKDEATRLAEEGLRSRLAACANVGAPIESVYWWQGEMQKSQEWPVHLKTTQTQLEALIKRLEELHSYECPCILSWAIEKGHGPFLEWVREETQRAKC